MESGAVYNQTTEPEAKASRRWPRFGFTLRRLWGWRLPVKVIQTVFGFFAALAFAAEFGIELFLKQKQKHVDERSGKPGNTPSSTENQPLNKKR
ncbi:hypothetical protein TURU_056046 [Turdus rufiventris]|nr:hypothetical protein TURU_056046 [Turdus rufiventris]